ncbi:family 16 glycoside hydrolase [Deminuibacter soli]|uniref:DUF1080 domain-containing protein n=1 Tax=Deminuibacter soli TaxID=2291815 RepID=A0A3E1NCY6_9BACT|nr:family 16 glycoside hydrolase [Deminuibacter soli]RFM25701.1 DUF1080 domain-containing protein [Deminuibacter soli]
MFQKLTAVFLLFLSLQAIAQKNKAQPSVINVALTAGNWDTAHGVVTFGEYKSKQAMQLQGGATTAVLKDVDFTDGTIEFDIEPSDRYFSSFYFRYAGKDNNECFYFRTQRAGNNSAIDAIQYTPTIKGVNLWDMLFHYQGNARFAANEWNHVKLVINGRQMQVYVNSTTPTLNIPILEGDSPHGALAFQGTVNIANLVIQPGATGNLPAFPGPDPTANDPQYLRKWLLGKPIVVPDSVEFSQHYIPAANAAWDTIWAERRGLINLTRQFGGSKQRRLVWLQTNIHADSAQTRKMQLGFSDDVWILLNGRFLYVDRNTYGSPIMKEPEGRCTIDNTSFSVPLKAGDNTLLIGVANNFYGWGIVARLDQLPGIHLE